MRAFIVFGNDYFVMFEKLHTHLPNFEETETCLIKYKISHMPKLQMKAGLNHEKCLKELWWENYTETSKIKKILDEVTKLRNKNVGNVLFKYADHHLFYRKI